MSTSSDFKDEFFETLSRIRSQTGRQGGSPLTLIEMLGAKKVPVQFYPPDPLTSHQDYYYNARNNVLYKRKKISLTRAVWKQVATV